MSKYLLLLFGRIEKVIAPKTAVAKTGIDKNLQGNWKFCKAINLIQIKFDTGSIKNIAKSV